MDGVSSPGVDVDAATGQTSEVYTFATVVNGVVTAVNRQPTPAAPTGTTAAPDDVAVGWTYDGTTFAAPPITPSAAQQALAAAKTGLETLYGQQGAISSQLQADVASVGSGWATLDAATQTAILGRILAGFGTVMQAIAAMVTLTGAVPPSS
jgi:hypothetical protein